MAVSRIGRNGNWLLFPRAAWRMIAPFAELHRSCNSLDFH
jgi:hypothetical protein